MPLPVQWPSLRRLHPNGYAIARYLIKNRYQIAKEWPTLLGERAFDDITVAIDYDYHENLLTASVYEYGNDEPVVQKSIRPLNMDNVGAFIEEVQNTDLGKIPKHH